MTALNFTVINSMNTTALNLLLCDALCKLKRRTRASRRRVWEPWLYVIKTKIYQVSLWKMLIYIYS